MLPMASSDANGMVIYLGKLDNLYFRVFRQDCSSGKFNFKPRTICRCWTAKAIYQQQMLSELIYEGDHRLLKKKHTGL
jgi:GntR family transcriptional regulator/MocR family aminotransferase